MWFFSALIAKIASAGAVAQAATGAGIVLVGFTGVGAAGALPAPVQHTFATVVSSITPLSVPDSTDPTAGTGTTDPTTPVTDPTESTDPTTTAADPTGTTAPAAPTSDAPNAFGKKVSEDAKNGGVDGQTVSSWAHDRNEARKHGSDATASETASPESDGSHESPDSETDGNTSDQQSSSPTGDHSGSESDGGHGGRTHH